MAELGMFKKLVVITFEEVVLFLKMLYALLPICRIIAEGHVAASAGVESVRAAVPAGIKKICGFSFSVCSRAGPAHMILFHVFV